MIWSPDKGAATAASGRRLGGDQYLAVPFGVGEIIEGCPDVLETDVAGNHRGDLDIAFGDRAQRIGEFVRVIGENELDVDLLGDGEERMQGVGLHAHADNDQPGAMPGSTHHVVDDAGHPDRLEYHSGRNGVEW